MAFDIVIPTLNINEARLTVESLKTHATYAHRYIVIDNGDNPAGYVEPCNAGTRAGSSEYVFYINDDVTVKTYGWDEEFVELAQQGTYCMYPDTAEERMMRLNGWFFGLKRLYIDAYGWAFDPRFVVWCGDVDLIKRLEQDHIEPVGVRGIDIAHAYTKTCSRPDLQEWIIPVQEEDLRKYREKWGSDPNKDKVK